MTQAANGNTVKVHYVGTLSDGTQFDSSRERQEPIEFTLGEGQMIPGFEAEVMGMTEGDSKSFAIAPEQAYGERNEELVQELERAQIPAEIELQEGLALQAQGPDGQVVRLTVKGFDDQTVKVDANHPLAGEELNFEVELMAVS